MRVIALACLLSLSRSTLVVPAIFRDGCVLQTNAEYGARSRIYGHATPAASVTVALKSGNLTTFAGADGSWTVTLNPLGEGETVDFTISTDEGESIAVKDCVVGDVYLCGGQRCARWERRTRAPPKLPARM